MNLQELQASMLRGEQAKGKAGGLEREYNRANALRGDSTLQPDKWGQVSPLAVLGDVLRQSQGRQGVREVTPKIDAAAAQAATSAGNMGANKLRMAFEKEQQGREAHGLKQALAGRQAEAHDLNMGTNAGKAENWVNETGDKLPVVYGPNNVPQLINGDPVPEGYTKEVRTYGGGGGGSGRGKAMSQNDIIKLNKNVSNVTNTRGLVDGWNDDFAQPTGLPTAIVDGIAKNLAGNDLLKLVGDDVDQDVKEAAQWWAGWRMNFTLDKRHELFGATLTTNEQKAWDDAELVKPGMDPKEIDRRINKLQEEAERSLMRRSNMSTTSGLQANRDVINRAVGHLFDYDAESNMYSAIVEGEISPEKLEGMVSSFTPEDQAEINAIENTEERAAMIAFVAQEMEAANANN